jgi:CPA2 family monovalent cation:H+ antiporter-2
MAHAELVLTIAAALTAALALGLLTHRLRLSPILGYLLAGVLLGPATPGALASADLAAQLAEIGVVLLMFGVGLEFHWKDLLAVRGVALPGAVATSAVAAGIGTALAMSAGWGLGEGAILGAGLAVASTVVLVRGLESAGRLEDHAGRVAVGWLVVEDLLAVLVLVMLPALAGTGGGADGPSAPAALALALLKIVLLVAVVLVGGGRAIPWVLLRVARTRSRELFTLTVLSVALAIAVAAAALFGVSMALGAFLAGMVVGQSRMSHQAAADALPLRDAFAVLFFVSVGMLFDPSVLAESPGLVAGALGVVLLAKPATAFLLVVVLGQAPRTALTVAVGLAQVGEFTFILAEVARGLGVLPAAGQSVLVTVALLTISLNPLLLRALPGLERWLAHRPRLWALANRGVRRVGARVGVHSRMRPPGEVHAVVVGYGPVGRTVARILADFHLKPVVVDLNADTVATLAAEGRAAVYGDARRPAVLAAAGVAEAQYLLVTLPDLESRLPIVLAARELNPSIKVLVRARYLTERAALEAVGATAAAYEEAEAAVALAEFLLLEVGASRDRLGAEADRIRSEFAVSRAPHPTDEGPPTAG